VGGGGGVPWSGIGEAPNPAACTRFYIADPRHCPSRRSLGRSPSRLFIGAWHTALAQGGLSTLFYPIQATLTSWGHLIRYGIVCLCVVSASRVARPPGDSKVRHRVFLVHTLHIPSRKETRSRNSGARSSLQCPAATTASASRRARARGTRRA
jgi:hypothetical protein